MRWTAKGLLCIEVVVCFAPMVLMLLLGVLLVPIQFLMINDEPLLWRDSANLFAQVACGLIGLITLVALLGSLLFGLKRLGGAWLVLTGAALGALPIVPIAVYGDPWGWKLLGALPLVATVHILYLSRRELFSSWRHALASMAIAASVVVVLHAIARFDPFEASDKELRAQSARWEASAPDRYEYTVQVSGGFGPEALNPKRIQVEDGEIVAATYAFGSTGRAGGAAAPLDNLWTIERAFAELRTAEAAGGTVTARFDLRWGFPERAFVEHGDDGPRWDLEVTEFEVLPAEAK